MHQFKKTLIMTKNIKYIFIALIGLVFALSCTDQWDDHYDANANPQLTNNVMDLISADPQLNRFEELLVKSGYDKELRGSKTYTVWAPTTEALSSLKDSVLNDSALLKKFVENHICYSQVFTNEFTSSRKIRTLAGKSILFYKSGDTVYYGSAKLLSLNNYARNGALFVVDKMVDVQQNIWEYLSDANKTPQYSKLRSYLLSLDNWIFDPILSGAIKIGVNKSGKNIYDSISATHFRFIYKNSFLDDVTNINSEDYDYTFFAIPDTAMESAFKRLAKYYRVSTNVAYSKVDTYNVFKDIVFKLAMRNKYDFSVLPSDSIWSENGEHLLSPKPYITSNPVALSNGYFYNTSSFFVPVSAMVKPIKIEAENSSGRKFFSSATIYGYSEVKQKRSYASGGYDFLLNPGTANVSKIDFGVTYDVADVKSVKYKFYWVTSPEEGGYQILEVYDAVSKSWKPIGTERLSKTSGSNLDYLGEYTFATVGKYQLRVRVTKPSVNNYLRLDYIYMVPQL